MVFNLIIKPIALKDIEEAIDWYEKKRLGLGLRFLQRVEECKNKILANPQIYLKITPNVRRIILKNFPYKIFYFVEKNNIFILGIVHQKRSDIFIRKKLSQ